MGMIDKYVKILKSSTVLFVEDDIKQKENIGEILSLFVKEVYFATTGTEALTKFKKLQPTFVITDIEIPNISGIELSRRIRLKNKDTPIIMISAYKKEEYLLDAIPLGLISYIVKPINAQSLIKSLEKVSTEIINNNLLKINLSNFCVYHISKQSITIKNKEYMLTSREAKFIRLLLQNKGSITTKSMIEQTLWGDGAMSESALKNFLSKLRKKIGHETILTVYSDGFRLA